MAVIDHRAELERARQSQAQPIVIFAHHPWFLKAADEPEYFNIPRARRAAYLGLFQEFDVKQLFSGHYHRNALARAGGTRDMNIGKPARAPA